MAGEAPGRSFFPLSFGGPWDESRTPVRVGANGGLVGLTACENLVYRRYGSWGKRVGSSIVYVVTAPAAGAVPAPPDPPPPFSPPPPDPPNAPDPPPGQPDPVNSGPVQGGGGTGGRIPPRPIE